MPAGPELYEVGTHWVCGTAGPEVLGPRSKWGAATHEVEEHVSIDEPKLHYGYISLKTKH